MFVHSKLIRKYKVGTFVLNWSSSSSEKKYMTLKCPKGATLARSTSVGNRQLQNRQKN